MNIGGAGAAGDGRADPRGADAAARAGGSGSGRGAGRGGRPAGVRVALPLLAALLAGGCATAPQSRQEAALVELVAWLPGRYDNRAQVATDLAHGRRPHAAVSATVVHIDSLTVGEQVFYLQEARTAGPADLPAQQVLSFAVVKDQIVETVYTLTDGRRWRGGDASPEMFSALQPQDLKMLTGCTLIWTRDGERFTAANDRHHCHAVPESVPAAVSAEWHLELTADELSHSERLYDADDAPVPGEDDPWLHLRKRVLDQP